MALAAAYRRLPTLLTRWTSSQVRPLSIIRETVHGFTCPAIRPSTYRSALHTCALLCTQAPVCLDTFTDHEWLVKEAAAKLARDKIWPLVLEMDKKSEIPKQLIDHLFGNGLMSIELPTEFGGLGLNIFSTVLVLEEISKVDMAVGIMVHVQNTLIGPFIETLGTPEQRQKYLPQLCTGLIGSFCMSEPGAGSDAFALKTRATKYGDMYTISGSKLWISNAKQAEVFIVMASTNPSQGHKGVTCFLVDRGTPGLVVGCKDDKLGVRASSTCPVHLDQVKIHESCILGEVGQGYKYAMNMLNKARIGAAAQAVGVAQGCLDITVPYLLERKQFGNYIFDFQGIQHQVALVRTKVEAARLLVYNATRRCDAGLPILQSAAMAKHFAAEVAHETSSRCLDWLGGVGVVDSFRVEKFYRDCKASTLYGGTSNIQLNMISKCIQSKYQS